MKKQSVLRVLVCVLFFIAFSIFDFALGGKELFLKTWYTYLWLAITLLSLLAVPLITKKRTEMFLFGTKISTFAMISFLLELIDGIVIIAIPIPSVKIPLIIFAVIFVIYFVTMLIYILSSRRIAEKIHLKEKRAVYITPALEAVKRCLRITTEKSVVKNLKKLQKTLKKSPVEVIEMAKPHEKVVLDHMSEIENAIRNHDYICACELCEDAWHQAELRNEEVDTAKSHNHLDDGDMKRGK